MADVPPVPARPDDPSEVFAALTIDAAACRALLEDVVLRSYTAMSVLEEEHLQPDWSMATPLLFAFDGIGLVASAPSREFPSRRRNRGCDGGLRVVR